MTFKGLNPEGVRSNPLGCLAFFWFFRLLCKGRLRPMAVLEILRFPDPRLRKKCIPVEKVGKPELNLADDMLETMSEAKGVGLSAIQVARFVRILTADTRILSQNSDSPGEEGRYPPTPLGEWERQVHQPLVLFNPRILDREGEVVFQEGCLSFPSYYAEVKRSAVVVVEGLNRQGQKVCIKTDGVLSVCLQHEIDHLDGKLFIDHLSPLKTSRLRAEIKKHGYPDLRKTSAS